MTDSLRPVRAIDMIDAPLRGAPLAVMLVLMAAGSGVVVAGPAGGSVITCVMVAALPVTLLMSPWWMSVLASRRWPPEPPRPRWFEPAVRSVSLTLLVGVVLSSVVGWNWFAWVLFGVHGACTLVAIPFALRRYPGVFPPAVR